MYSTYWERQKADIDDLKKEESVIVTKTTNVEDERSISNEQYEKKIKNY